MTRCLILLASLVSASHAAEVRTAVSYVSLEAVFLNAGRELGIQVGDTAVIFRNDQLIDRLEIAYVSAHSASCKMPTGDIDIRVGDIVIVHAIDSTTLPQVEMFHTAESTTNQLPVTQSKRRSSRTTALTGRVSFRMYWQDDHSALNNDYQEPSLAVNGKLSRIGGSLWNASLRVRLREEFRTPATSSAIAAQWDNRVYEAAILYGEDGSQYAMKAGRFTANSLSGIGYIDGVLVSVKAVNSVRVGLFGGTQPDLRSTDFQTEEVKSGLFASYSTPRSGTSNWNSTLALAGRYRAGEISREFIYEQLQYTSGSRIRFYENVEINLNRGWLKNAEGSSLTLSSLMSGLNWSPTPWLTSEISYSNRRNYFTLETRHIADSLFDDAVRQGVRSAVRARAHSWFAGVGGNLRSTGPDYSAGSSYTVNGGSSNFLRTLTNLEVRWTHYNNEHSTGSQPVISIQRPIFSVVNCGIEIGQDRYQFKSSPLEVRNEWSRATLDWHLTKQVFGSAYVEARTEGDQTLHHFFVETGYRF